MSDATEIARAEKYKLVIDDYLSVTDQAERDRFNTRIQEYLSQDYGFDFRHAYFNDPLVQHLAQSCAYLAYLPDGFKKVLMEQLANRANRNTKIKDEFGVGELVIINDGNDGISFMRENPNGVWRDEDRSPVSWLDKEGCKKLRDWLTTAILKDEHEG